MNCQEVRELSSDYLDQRLVLSEASLLEDHLKLCSACREEIEVLRRTISAIGSLDEIKTSPDFLSQVHRKIDEGGWLTRVWAWIFKPVKIKVPLEVTALLLVSITAFYLFYRSPELSRESGIPASMDSLKATQDKRVDEVQEKKALEKRDRRRESNRMAEPEAPAKLEAQLYQPKSLKASKEGLGDRAVLAPQPEIQEVLADDVALYERRVKVLLAEVGGRLLIQEGSPGSVLLTVELPESRQAEFLAALKEEVRFRTKSKVAKGRQSRAGGYVQEKDALDAAARKLAPAQESSLRMDEPMVTLRLRILPKK